MASALDNYWSDVYLRNVDFMLISALDIDRFLSQYDRTAPSRCLDIGCGTGQLTREIFHRGFTVVGIDSSREAIRRARSYTVCPPNKLVYIQFDVEKKSFQELPGGPYGLIFCKLVYAFIHNKKAFIARVSRLLSVDGVFVLITPFVDRVRANKRDVAVDRSDTLRLLQRYFEVDYWESVELGYFVCKHLKGEPPLPRSN